MENEKLNALASEMDGESNDSNTQISVDKQGREVTSLQIKPVMASSKFTEKVNEVKGKILDDASENSEEFISEFTANVKDAAVKLVEVEKEKAELEKQNIIYHQELLEKGKLINEYEKRDNEWENKQKKRQFHYDGVKPIMLFVGVTDPMSLFFLYSLTVFLTPFFLFQKFWTGTFGAILSGAKEEDRENTAKGFLWTLLCLLAVSAIAIPTLIILNHYGVISPR